MNWWFRTVSGTAWSTSTHHCTRLTFREQKFLENDRMETASTDVISIWRRKNIEKSIDISSNWKVKPTSNQCHNFHVDLPFKIDEILTNFPRGISTSNWWRIDKDVSLGYLWCFHWDIFDLSIGTSLMCPLPIFSSHSFSHEFRSLISYFWENDFCFSFWTFWKIWFINFKDFFSIQTRVFSKCQKCGGILCYFVWGQMRQNDFHCVRDLVVDCYS